jgi:hypothetical protein
MRKLRVRSKVQGGTQTEEVNDFIAQMKELTAKIQREDKDFDDLSAMIQHREAITVDPRA